MRALIAAEVGPDDVFIDIGSGMGKVTTLARVLTGARVRGIEYVRAGGLAPRLDGVEYVHGDARKAPLDDGTVFFLYAPFTGALRREVFATSRGGEAARHRGVRDGLRRRA